MKPRLRALALLALLPLLSACAGQRLADYGATTPAFDLFGYFSGPVRGYGMVQERDGTVIRRFTVELTGTVAGDTLTLDEHFLYDDGERQQRTWVVRQVAPGRYTGTAGDVVGEASGAAAGAAFNWRYVLRLSAKGREWELPFDDWMYVQDGRVVMNRTTFSLLGVELGAVTLFFVKDPAQALAAGAGQ